MKCQSSANTSSVQAGASPPAAIEGHEWSGEGQEDMKPILPSPQARSRTPALSLALDDLSPGLATHPSLAGILQAEPSPEPPEQLPIPEDLPCEMLIL